MTYPNGAIYDGNWEHNQRNGLGKCVEGVDEIYEGNWKNDKRHGFGTLKWASG